MREVHDRSPLKRTEKSPSLSWKKGESLESSLSFLNKETIFYSRKHQSDNNEECKEENFERDR